jgi:hypothetical protein
MRARQTERFEATLIALANHIESAGFDGRGGFYAWERLKGLLQGLQMALDYYELEGDVAPARREFESYRQDLSRVGLQADRWVAVAIGQLLGDLEAKDGGWELRVGVDAPESGAYVPAGMLTVHPQALADLMQRRSSTSSSGAGA